MFLALFILSDGMAQSIVPGYLGKKNIAFVGGHLNILSGYNYLVDGQNTNSNYNITALGYSFGLQSVIGKSAMVGASFLLHKNDVFRSPGPSFQAATYSGFQSSLQLRSYRYKTRGSIAPIGKHYRYNISMESNKVTTTTSNQLIGKTVDMGVGFGTGNSRIFYDKLWVDYGFEFNYFFNVYDQQDVLTGFEYTAQTRNNLKTMYLITFKANFGYIF